MIKKKPLLNNAIIECYSVKENINVVLEPLSKIIKINLSTGLFPVLLKKSTVSPIFKGGESEAIEQYIPVTLLQLFTLYTL